MDNNERRPCREQNGIENEIQVRLEYQISHTTIRERSRGEGDVEKIATPKRRTHSTNEKQQMDNKNT